VTHHTKWGGRKKESRGTRWGNRESRSDWGKRPREILSFITPGIGKPATQRAGRVRTTAVERERLEKRREEKRQAEKLPGATCVFIKNRKRKPPSSGWKEEKPRQLEKKKGIQRKGRLNVGRHTISRHIGLTVMGKTSTRYYSSKEIKRRGR